ncbi:efflux transporter, RND family, MFP subunit [Thiorhodococcus drewsii AZ1]|uniref:Efflux transporter, RND family, MFP subunit n=1 Tax=Thiorhodococcus drewsii AZ1 TaxID=765913 RepID=G2E781_9GAMM|nr:efflux RND transporter periplasmic adaptor subunit [Thiorhodococcus drewsii]EGV28048.1 efflux transporter, RND family, MFP subunit [Thiorhodococcus drewsii AZ1]
MTRSSVLRAVVFSAGALSLVGCNQPTGQGAGPGKGAQMSAPEVSVVTAHVQSLPLTRELVGRLAATRTAQVRARVAGIVLKRVYTEGTDVKQGQVLFQIDPAQLEAKLKAEEAALAKAEADAVNAALTAKRYLELREKKTISQQDLDTAQAAERTTAAAVKQARANVDGARLNLSYATVRAPIAGRAGRALVTEGALVGQNEATLLTTVEQIDPIYVNFSQSVQELTELQEMAVDSRKPGALASKARTSVEVRLPGSGAYSEAGTLDFSDLAVDPGTGAVSLRATLPNPHRALLPGMFVTLRLTTGRLDQAVLLPQAALARDGRGAYVMVLNAEGKVEQRRVESHGMTRQDWILTGDLAEGDRVIVTGLQKVKPGAMAQAAPADEAASSADKKAAKASSASTGSVAGT